MIYDGWFAYDMGSAILPGKPVRFLKKHKEVCGLVPTFATRFFLAISWMRSDVMMLCKNDLVGT